MPPNEALPATMKYQIFLPKLARFSRKRGDMKSMKSLSLLCGLALLAASALPAHAGKETPPTTGPTIPGSVAALKGRIAYAPENAPDCVKRAIWATNYLTFRPYVWGGGHGTFYDRGYDCSGTIS